MARASERRIDDVKQEDLRGALRRLDAQIHTVLTIQREGEQHPTIGGGAGQSVVYATFDNSTFWNLGRTDRAAGTIMLFVGGQHGDLPDQQIVTEQEARTAGLAFLSRGELQPPQNWLQQS